MYKKNIFLILALSLTACNSTEDKSTSEYQGKSYVGSVKPEIHNQYLKCYALDKSAKQECVDELTAKFIDQKWQQDKEFINSFQYEAEKLGFKHFINDLGLACESINDGPKFIEDKRAYLVQCKPDHQYFMQFDYNNKKWNLINGGH